MIIGLTGYAQSGKDTVANVLVERYGFTRIAFADKIREYLYEINPVYDYIAGDMLFIRAKVDRDGWEEAKKFPYIRRLLQTSGVAARKLFGEDFWIKQALKDIEFGGDYVITDVRFQNEADAIKSMGGQIWRIKRLGVDPVNSHVSETQMDGYPVDQIFINNSTLDDLEALIKVRMSGYAQSK
jgi:hypothetical protein